MKKLGYWKRDDDAMLVIWQCKCGDLIGEVYNNGKFQRGKWNMRARFCAKYKEATTQRVFEYFGFSMRIKECSFNENIKF